MVTYLVNTIRIASHDAFVIATPPSTHASLALRALGAGKHVLVEKPLATRSADVQAADGWIRGKHVDAGVRASGLPVTVQGNPAGAPGEAPVPEEQHVGGGTDGGYRASSGGTGGQRGPVKPDSAHDDLLSS